MCLQESEIEQAFVGDLTKLFDNSLRPIGLENWPEVIRYCVNLFNFLNSLPSFRTYERIGIKYEPLTLVSPAFQVSMPVFQAAVCINLTLIVKLMNNQMYKYKNFYFFYKH